MRRRERAAGCRIERLDRSRPDFYCLLGPWLGNRAIARDLGSPLWDEPGKEWLVAMRDDQVIGVCAWLPGPRQTRLLSAYVLSEHRRQGVYTALFAERLRLVGNGCLVSTVTSASLGTFLRNGFEVAGRRGKYAHVRRSTPGIA